MMFIAVDSWRKHFDFFFLFFSFTSQIIDNELCYFCDEENLTNSIA